MIIVQLDSEQLSSIVQLAVKKALTENQQTKAPEPETYIHGLQALADFLGIGVTTAWKLKKRGLLPYYKAGKKLYFKKSEIEASTAIVSK